MTDDITQADIDTTYRVLETLRDDYHEDERGCREVLNEAHYLVQLHEAEKESPDSEDLPPKVDFDLPFEALLAGTPAYPYFDRGYSIHMLAWQQGGLNITLEDDA